MNEKRGEHRKKWAEQNNISPKACMKRRKDGHNYHGRCIYMVTLSTNKRESLLGTLQGMDDNHSEPWIKNNDIGNKITLYWNSIPTKYPEIKSLGLQIMPDHIHGILFVTKQINTHLGQVMAWFKKETNSIYFKETGNSLWEPGFNDTILSSKGQLKRMTSYIQDNPRRLWVKLHNYDYFKVVDRVIDSDWHAKIMGNRFLLEHSCKVVVKCSRSINTDEAIEKEVKKYMALSQNGVVLVSAFISKAEKAVLRAAHEAHCKMIILLENGFAPLWKPSGKMFNECASGNLLFVAPWAHHNQKRSITREQCLQLNELAQVIADNT